MPRVDRPGSRERPGTERSFLGMSGSNSENDVQPSGVQTDKWTRWMIAIAVMVSAVMELVDTSAVNVSLPYIAGNLSASVDEATRVLTSYWVANALILPLSGWLANYLGRRRLLMLSVIGFTAASILCGLAPTLPVLVFCRILQGGSGVGAYIFSYLNTNAGPWSFFWPQIVMGAGLSFMFVPLATITVDPIPQEEMGYATSLIALARNLGAGIGISVFTAFYCAPGTISPGSLSRLDGTRTPSALEWNLRAATLFGGPRPNHRLDRVSGAGSDLPSDAAASVRAELSRWLPRNGCPPVGHCAVRMAYEETALQIGKQQRRMNLDNSSHPR
jgi:Major Facilitator Superfamily